MNYVQRQSQNKVRDVQQIRKVDYGSRQFSRIHRSNVAREHSWPSHDHDSGSNHNFYHRPLLNRESCFEVLLLPAYNPAEFSRDLFGNLNGGLYYCIRVAIKLSY